MSTRDQDVQSRETVQNLGTFFGLPLRSPDLPLGQVLHVVNLVTAKSPPGGILSLRLLCSDPDRFPAKKASQEKFCTELHQ